MDSNIQLYEGMRLPRKIFNAFLSYLESDEPFNMGFEVEFYARELIHGSVVANLSEIGYSQAFRYFEITEINPEALMEWIEDNQDYLLGEAGTSRDEIENDVFEEWFDDNPDWYEEYLKENGEWDEEKDRPAENATDEDTAYDEVKDDVRNDVKTFGKYKDFDSKISERTSEAIDRIDVLAVWWDYDHHNLIQENNWELSFEYSYDESDEDIILEGHGGELDSVAAKLSEIVDEDIEVDDEYSSASGEPSQTYWVVQKDGSLNESAGGVEISSPVFPIMEGIERLKKVLDWIEDIDGETDDSTGLHISLSFTDFKEIQDIDWLKIAILSGEEHMLRQFGRFFNNATYSQLKFVKVTAGQGDIEDLLNLRTFQELKDNFAKGIAEKTKETSFNIRDYEHSDGRVEWRIMGGRDYHHKIDVIENNILKLAFAMEIGADPNAFKNEYLRELGKLLSEVLDTKVKSSDTLSDKQKLLYGGEESELLRRNPFFSKAINILKGSNLLEHYQAWTLYAERMKETPSEETKKQYLNAAYLFFDKVVVFQTQEYNKLVEASGQTITLNPKSEMIVKLTRNTSARYGFNMEDFNNLYRKDAFVSLIEHYPIADHITMPAGLPYCVAALVFSEMDEELKKRKMEFLHVLPVIKSFGTIKRSIITAISWSTKSSTTNYAGDLVVNNLVLGMRYIKDNKVNDHVEYEQRKLINNILQKANIPEEIKTHPEISDFERSISSQPLDNADAGMYDRQHEH